MKEARSANELISAYSPELQSLINDARKFLLKSLPGATKQVDPTAAVLSYGYGPGYREMVCTLILSKTGVKLGSLTARNSTTQRVSWKGPASYTSTFQRRAFCMAETDSQLPKTSLTFLALDHRTFSPGK
jgi:hypothetical protein